MAELTLNGLRRYAILNRVPITYRDASGREARINGKGIVEVPGLTQAPSFNVEELLRVANEFVLQPEGSKARPSRLDRAQIAQLVAGGDSHGAESHDEE